MVISWGAQIFPHVRIPNEDNAHIIHFGFCAE